MVDILVSHFCNFKNLQILASLLSELTWTACPPLQSLRSTRANILARSSLSVNRLPCYCIWKAIILRVFRWVKEPVRLTQWPLQPAWWECVPGRNLSRSSGPEASILLESCPNLKVRLQLSWKILVISCTAELKIPTKHQNVWDKRALCKLRRKIKDISIILSLSQIWIMLKDFQMTPFNSFFARSTRICP